MLSSNSTASNEALSTSPRSTEDNPIETCEAERVLVEQSNRLTALFALCIGLEETHDNGSRKPLLDLNEEPFKFLKKKEIKPSVDCLRDEVKRRSGRAPINTKPPKPNGWNASKCIEWLKENPITSEDDIAFLKTKAKEVREVVANATQRMASSTTTESTDGDRETGNKWVGHLPYLRLIHCLLEDDVKEKWIHRNDPKSIQEIDARRSEVRDETAFEMIANRWNCKDFNPKTMVSNCHIDFNQVIDIGFDATSDFARASPTKVRDKIAKMRSDLTSIIHKWERSGQGEGGMLEEEDEDDDISEDISETPTDMSERQNPAVLREKFEWGRSKGRMGAFDCRESFLGPNPPYLLYFWEVLDQNDLINTTMNRISDDAGASSANEAPSITSTNAKSSWTSINDDVTVFVASFREVIVEASKDATIAANKRHEENKQDKERRHKEAQEAENNRVLMKSTAADKRVILQAELENKGYLKRRIDSLQDEARRIRFKIFECKGNSDEETFFTDELKKIVDEITKCNTELNMN
jgi:hypothetical protein